MDSFLKNSLNLFSWPSLEVLDMQKGRPWIYCHLALYSWLLLEKYKLME